MTFDQRIAKIRSSNPALATKIMGLGGSVTADMVTDLINIDRLMLVLVICGCGRFICPVQDVAHFVKIIDEHRETKSDAADYVRYISIHS